MNPTDRRNEAVRLCRMWYLRYESIPLSDTEEREEALTWAEIWGEIAKSIDPDADRERYPN